MTTQDTDRTLTVTLSLDLPEDVARQFVTALAADHAVALLALALSLGAKMPEPAAPPAAPNHRKVGPVRVYDKAGTLLGEYNTQQAAAAAHGVSGPAVGYALERRKGWVRKAGLRFERGTLPAGN